MLMVRPPEADLTIGLCRHRYVAVAVEHL